MLKSTKEIRAELPRIIRFIQDYAQENERIVVPVSGGLDSDVVARLCVLALGKDRVRLFTVHQAGMEVKFIKNAILLAEDLAVPLAHIKIGAMNRELICILKEADPTVPFDSDSLLDPARANCSLRTAVISSYQDKGFLIAANSNRSEIELGFFMPFGDNLGHFKPIAHLYKSEVRLLAELVGTRSEVLAQNPSAGFWEGENDLEDIAYWLYNGGPIAGSRTFTDEDDEKVREILAQLTQKKIDECLLALHTRVSDGEISCQTGLPEGIVQAMRKTVLESKRVKRRPLMKNLER